MGLLEYSFLTIEAPTPPADILISSVSITSPEITLPQANNADVRDDIVIGSVINLVVDILPIDATNKNYTITVSNSRGTVNGHEVTFNTLGLISILVTFEDTSVGVSGVFNFRFTIVEAPTPPENVSISSVTVTSNEITMPNVNDAASRPQVTIGTVITLIIDILPENATNKNYTITVSNSRAQVNGHQVTFVLGSGVGSVSIRVTFEDTSVGINGLLEYRFSTIQP
jgi:hypothetical protein